MGGELLDAFVDLAEVGVAGEVGDGEHALEGGGEVGGDVFALGGVSGEYSRGGECSGRIEV